MHLACLILLSCRQHNIIACFVVCLESGSKWSWLTFVQSKQNKSNGDRRWPWLSTKNAVWERWSQASPVHRSKTLDHYIQAHHTAEWGSGWHSDADHTKRLVAIVFCLFCCPNHMAGGRSHIRHYWGTGQTFRGVVCWEVSRTEECPFRGLWDPRKELFCFLAMK